MKITYYNRIVLNIPSKIINFNKFNGVTFNLERKVTPDDKAILYNINDIKELKIILSNDYDHINNYIHRFNLIKHDLNKYYLEKNKLNTFTNYSMILNTCWFIGEL